MLFRGRNPDVTVWKRFRSGADGFTFIENTRPQWSVIYNCASANDYRFESATEPKSAPLMFLGQLEPCRGAHTAIEVAKSWVGHL